MNPGTFTSSSPPERSNVPEVDIAAEPVPQTASTYRLAISVLKYLEGRGILLGIETREALQQVVGVLLWLALGAIAAFAGWLLLAASLVGALSEHLDWSWINASAIVGVAHLLIAFTAALRTWNRVTTARWFADSFNELKKDRTWLKRQTPKN